MKIGRVIYIVTLIVSIVLAVFFAFQYYSKDKQLKEYQNLAHLSLEAFKRANVELQKTKKELDRTKLELTMAQDEANILNATIAALEQDKDTYKEELTALLLQRDKLENRISSLEVKTFTLEQRFQSLEELKKAIKAVKSEKKEKQRLVRIEMLKRLDEIALRQGNRGFMTKEGETTFKPTKIRVELEPTTAISFSETK